MVEWEANDGLIKRNPCRIDGAGQEHSPERPVLTIAQVFALADAFTDRRYRLLILLAVFCSLRWGELAALARSSIPTRPSSPCGLAWLSLLAVRSSRVRLRRLQVSAT